MQLHRRFAARPELRHLRHIAIDEIAVAEGHRSRTVAPDLKRGAVAFVGDGEGGGASEPSWEQLRPVQGHDRGGGARHVPADREVVSTHLPVAVIAFDRSHVIKLCNEERSDLRREL